MTLLAGGDVLVGDEKVGTYADGKLVVDGVHVGQLEADGEFRLGGFDDAVFQVDETGVMAKEGAEGGYVAYAEDGTMQGGVVEETKGMKGQIEGDPGLRREMTFLFMALTVARGPAISDAGRLNNAVVLDGGTGSEEVADDTGGGESANVE